MSDMKLISWPGNKRRQLDQLLQYVPDNLSAEAAICEPFFGTGAFTLALLENTTGPVFAAEANCPLRNWWQWMFERPADMVEIMASYRQEFAAAGVDRDVFNALRDGWNQLNRERPTCSNAAGMLWVLIYQSTNNLARFNQKGEYNQTWGKGRKVPDPAQVFTAPVLQRIAQLADAVKRGCFAADFRDVLDLFMEYDREGVCYLDPPYILETGTYQTDCWGPRELRDLMEWVEALEKAGCWWMWTDYMRNADKRHPYEQTLKQHFRIMPFVRNHDSRPNGKADRKEEALILGSVVEEPQYQETQLSLEAADAD